jgi:hypothetical protein
MPCSNSGFSSRASYNFSYGNIALAWFSHQLYAMAYSCLFPQILAPALLLLILCLGLIWQRRKKICRRSQQSIGKDFTCQRPDVVPCWDRVRGEGSLLDDEKGTLASNPACATFMDGACLTEILQPSITSGQYAAMVQWRDEHNDTQSSSMHPPPHPCASKASCSRFTPWSNARIERDIKIENHSIDFYRGSEPQEIWRRRVLAFVGQ